MLSNGIHIGRRGGVRLTGGGGGFAYDAVPSIVAAYGMRRLLGTYSGSILRLRRSSDDAQSDFGALGNGDLDTGAISAWLGGNSGYVVTWYDQSGGARNATQATAANQPLYVAGGQNGRPTVRGDGSNDSLSASVTQAQPFSQLLVFKPRTYTFARTIVTNTRQENNVTEIRSDNTFVADVYLALNSPGVLTLLRNGSSSIRRINGSAVTYTSSANLAGTLQMCEANVDICELVIASGFWSDAQRQAAEAAANAYWAVY